MAQDLKVGKFWRDTINGDLLRIQSFTTDVQPVGPVVYVKCACFVDRVFFGIQEMKSSQLLEERFKKVNWLMQWWYRRKFKGLSKP